MRRKGKGQFGAVSIGYLPCFSRHLDSKYPLDNFYRNKVFLEKVQKFMSLIKVSIDLKELKNQGACKKVTKITPGDAESQQIIKFCNFDEGELYRAGWGNCPYRLIFGLDTKNRRCHIFMLDALHSTYSGKTRR